MTNRSRVLISRWRRAKALALELLLALLGVLSALFFIFQPATIGAVSINDIFGPLAWLWVSQYLVGGTAIIAGIVGMWRNIEGAGLALYTSGALMQFVAVVVRFGPASLLQAAIYVAVAVAFALRLHSLYRGEDIVTVSEEVEDDDGPHRADG